MSIMFDMTRQWRFSKIQSPKLDGCINVIVLPGPPPPATPLRKG